MQEREIFPKEVTLDYLDYLTLKDRAEGKGMKEAKPSLDLSTDLFKIFAHIINRDNFESRGLSKQDIEHLIKRLELKTISLGQVKINGSVFETPIYIPK